MRKESRLIKPVVFLLSALFMLIAGQSLLSGQEKKWPEIAPEELAMTDCPQQPGAAAIYLYREEIEDRSESLTSIFERIKILTPAGRDYGNIEIIYRPEYETVEKIQVRVVSPGGQARDFQGNIMEKTGIKVGSLEVKIKTIAVPDVSPGDIIDYRYNIRTKKVELGGQRFDFSILLNARTEIFGEKIYSLPATTWYLEADLFTRKLRFVFESERSVATLFDGRCRLAWVSNKLKGNLPVSSGNRIELVAENIPAFEEERFMPPEDNERMLVNLFYIDDQIKDFDDYWEKVARAWKGEAESFMRGKSELNQEITFIVGDETDPLVKLKKIYEQVQKIQNLSYAEEMTSEEEKRYKDNKKVADVLKNRYGYRTEITRTFISLARAAGLEANLVRVVSRDDKLFRRTLPLFYTQFDAELALVRIGDKVQAFDPGTPFCPFGLIHWTKSNTTAISYENKQVSFLTTPLFPPETALTQRQFSLALDREGNLSGQVKVTYQGQEALIRRLKYRHSDEQKKKDSFEEELKKILPLEAKVKLSNLTGLDESSASLEAEYEIAVPGMATQAGDKLLLPAYPLVNQDRYPFKSAQRKHPVYFDFPYREFDDIIITLPESMTAEARPEARKKETGFFSFGLQAVAEAPQKLHIQRDLIIKKSLLPVEDYPQVKNFFDFIRSSDEEQVVIGGMK